MTIDFLKSGKVGQIQLNEQKRLRKETMERWDSLGMVEGLRGTVKENVAMLYENQAEQLLREATSADNSGAFETVVFPIVRRVFSKLLANDIVSVQAMNLPTGKLFYLLPKVSERSWFAADGSELKGDEDLEKLDGAIGKHQGLMGYERTDRRNKGSKYNRFYLPDEAVKPMAFAQEGGADIEGVDNYDAARAQATDAVLSQKSPKVTKFHERSLYDLFYNDFLYDNSRGKIHIKVGEVTLDDEIAPKQYVDETYRNVVVKVGGFSSVAAGRIVGPDGNEMDNEEFLASMKVFAKKAITEEVDGKQVTLFAQNEGIEFRVVTNRYGHGIVDYEDICSPQGYIYLELNLAKPAESFDGWKGMTTVPTADMFGVAWSQYDSLELETEMGEVSFTITAVTVDAVTAKLRATWSPELAQDVAAFHNIDAEAELTALLSEEIACEIDRTILRDLRKIGWGLDFDVNGWRRMKAYSTNYTQKDWNQELITKINQISAQIHKSTLRGGANFVVVSSEVSALFDNLEYFHVSDADAEADQYNLGIERIGSLQSRYQVYRDPYAPARSVVIGHKGKSLLDTGYIYAPYVPMMLTPTIFNPENFAPVKGIMTRFAKKCVNTRFYGHVNVHGLQQWDPRELR